MTEPDEAQAEFDTALKMLRYAEDTSGNRGLVFGYCKEHDWRGRRRDVNNRYANSHTVRMLAVDDTRAHLRKKHRSDASTAS